MPEIRRQSLPPAIFRHLLDRIQLREVSSDQLRALADWLDTSPIVPEGLWYKRFAEMTVCGEGELVKTILTKDQSPFGEEV